MLGRLIKVFKAKNTFDLVIIFLVFALAGSTTAFLAAYVKPIFGITSDTAIWVKILFFIFASLPIYQVILLAYGLIFLKFKYFLNFEKKMFGRWFGKRKA